MHTSYQLTKNVQIFRLIQNLFNQHYYSAGTFQYRRIQQLHARRTTSFTFNDPRTFPVNSASDLRRHKSDILMPGMNCKRQLDGNYCRFFRGLMVRETREAALLTMGV
jgi:hypothetical protein